MNKASAVKGVNFGSVDVEGLELYDRALSTDEKAKVSPEARGKGRNSLRAADLNDAYRPLTVDHLAQS